MLPRDSVAEVRRVHPGVEVTRRLDTVHVLLKAREALGLPLSPRLQDFRRHHTLVAHGDEMEPCAAEQGRWSQPPRRHMLRDTCIQQHGLHMMDPQRAADGGVPVAVALSDQVKHLQAEIVAIGACIAVPYML
jgi:hypothetical protein